MILSMLLLLVVTLLSPTLQDSTIERHERFLSYLPDGTYQVLSHFDYEKIRSAGIVRDHPEFFGFAKSNGGLPFPEAQASYSYSARLLDVAGSVTEANKSKVENGRRMIPINAKGRLSIVEIPGLAMHIEEALKKDPLASSGERIGGAAVYKIDRYDETGRKDAYFCSPEPDLVLIADNHELLRAMVFAGQSESPSFVDSNTYSDLIEYAGDSARWTVSFMSSMFASYENEFIKRGEDPAHIDAWERRRKRMPQVRVSRNDYFGEEYRHTFELVFYDEEAAENWQKMRQVPPPANIPRPDEPKKPEELVRYENKIEALRMQRIDGNRIITETTRTAKDLAERERLRKKHADYYKQLDEAREQSEKKQK